MLIAQNPYAYSVPAPNQKLVIMSDAQIFWDREAMVSSRPEINWQYLMKKRAYPS